VIFDFRFSILDWRLRAVSTAALLSAAVLLLSACSLPAEPEPPAAGTFDAALAAVNRGDLAALRAEISKGGGLNSRARADMGKLDPEAWLILQGARWREHDLAACYRASDDVAMAAALGFSDDALTSTLLRAPSRQSERIAEARRHFRNVEPPARLFADLDPKPCPPSFSAYLLKYKAELSERVCVALIGFAGMRLTELHAAEEYGVPEEPAPGAAFANPAAALSSREFTPLLVLFPQTLPSAACGLELAAVDDAGTVYWASWVAKQGRWQLRFAYRNTLAQRLQRAREDALRKIREAARTWLEQRKSWPAPAELNLQPHDWVDAGGDSGERGWQVHATAPKTGFRLANGGLLPPKAEDPLVWTQDGRYGIAWDGRFLTVP